MIDIQHYPMFDTAKVEKIYSEKDGVDVKYVCTSALGGQEFAVDVFYRATPHPEFGNRYFGLYSNLYSGNAQIMITNADVIEDLEFGMIQDDNGTYYYSSHRHDYKVLDNGKMIDGGRAYIRSNGNVITVRIRDGKFFIKELEDMVDYHNQKV